MEILRNARRDFLTDFYMKEELDPILMKVKAECKVYKRPFSILVIDLDHFKSYNDKYGHLDGDEVLKYFSSTVRLSLDEGECIPIRFGGDEFIVIFPGKNANQAHVIAEELKRNLKKRPFLMRGRVFKMSFSGGIVSYPTDGEEAEILLEKADKAMYYSKTHGRGRTTLYNAMLFKTFRRLLIFIGMAFVIYAAVYYWSHKYNNRVVEIVSRIKGSKIVRNIAPLASAKTAEEPDMVEIYLKSGSIFRGSVIREDDRELYMKLSLDRGEGAIIIKKSNIDKIERAAPAKTVK